MDARAIGQKIKQAYPNSRYSTLDDELLGQMYLKKYTDKEGGTAFPFNYLGGSYLPAPSTTDMSDNNVFFDPEEAFNKFKKTQTPSAPATPTQGGLTTNINTQSATLAPPKPKQPNTVANLPTALPNIQPGAVNDTLKNKLFTL